LKIHWCEKEDDGGLGGKGEQKKYFVLFSRSGFTENLKKIGQERGDLLLWN
jgi:hypothetical protein